MAFQQEVTRTPTDIGAITIHLTTTGPDGAGGQAEYTVKVVFSDGSVVTREGDLIPHLTQAQINSLINFMNILRTKANAEILT